ncbi:hypothetical protein KY290_038311 [Solanum tuberosum]|uniref:Uncharacterized protein n=1 Tax=Solanum tuberosum TaxID=4113 RepID=A0ABQ7TZT0_SOLTU|nr:hypothetical protein KY290_038311 [Solanum tuberosum]
MALASEISIAGILASSAIAACFAELCTLPLDTAKVRLQLQKRAGEGSGKYRGLLGTVATIAKEEGLLALWKGIVPGLHRQCIYGGLRIGLYEPVKAFFAHTYYVEMVPYSLKCLLLLLLPLSGSLDHPFRSLPQSAFVSGPPSLPVGHLLPHSYLGKATVLLYIFVVCSSAVCTLQNRVILHMENSCMFLLGWSMLGTLDNEYVDLSNEGSHYPNVEK